MAEENDYVPYDLAPTIQLFNIAWTRTESFFQCNYTRKEVFGLVSDGGDFLPIGLSEKNSDRRIVSELCNRQTQFLRGL